MTPLGKNDRGLHGYLHHNAVQVPDTSVLIGRQRENGENKIDIVTLQ